MTSVNIDNEQKPLNLIAVDNLSKVKKTVATVKKQFVISNPGNFLDTCHIARLHTTLRDPIDRGRPWTALPKLHLFKK